MSKAITIPPNVWTQIAPAGFGSLVIQPIGGNLIVEFGASPPPNAEADWGVEYSDRQPVSAGTDVATANMYGRPSATNGTVTVRFLS
jgi:hypothetical protein